jgi:hypothetical protein
VFHVKHSLRLGPISVMPNVASRQRIGSARRCRLLGGGVRVVAAWLSIRDKVAGESARVSRETSWRQGREMTNLPTQSTRPRCHSTVEVTGFS